GAEVAPAELSEIATVWRVPPMPFVPEEAHGKLAIMALMTYAGDVEAGQEALAPFRARGAPLSGTPPTDAARRPPGGLPPAHAVPRGLPARGGGVPPGRNGAHDVRRHDRASRGRDDP